MHSLHQLKCSSSDLLLLTHRYPRVTIARKIYFWIITMQKVLSSVRVMQLHGARRNEPRQQDFVILPFTLMQISYCLTCYDICIAFSFIWIKYWWCYCLHWIWICQWKKKMCTAYTNNKVTIFSNVFANYSNSSAFRSFICLPRFS